jgi:dihydrodipicolinate synthase/N-acetylneuraminate lyase
LITAGEYFIVVFTHDLHISAGLSFPAFTKVVLTALGLDVGQPRPPLSPYSDSVKEGVKEDLRKLGFFDWSL